MLAGAVALGVLSTPDGAHVSFSFADLSQRAHNLSGGTQYWIFALFALWFVAPGLRRVLGAVTGYVGHDPLSIAPFAWSPN